MTPIEKEGQEAAEAKKKAAEEKFKECAEAYAILAKSMSEKSLEHVHAVIHATGSSVDRALRELRQGITLKHIERVGVAHQRPPGSGPLPER